MKRIFSTLQVLIFVVWAFFLGVVTSVTLQSKAETSAPEVLKMNSVQESQSIDFKYEIVNVYGRKYIVFTTGVGIAVIKYD